MIVNTVAANVSMSPFTETKAATMEASAHAMSIMAKQLYTRPIYAVVREILSNAVDANMSVNSTTPVLVIAPSERDPVLYIRDYGTGISDERMMNDYLRFFMSTKSLENDQIGGFGVGSKSPYAYTTHFTVVSRVDGMKRCYMCITAPNGIYEIGKLPGEEPTTEGNGLEICVPVQARDISEFKEAIQCYAPCFGSNSVRVIGMENYQPSISYTHDYQHWALVDYNAKDYDVAIRRGSYVRVGPVPYAVDWWSLHSSEIIKHMLAEGVEFRLPIGSVDISPSRETLNMSERTCNVLNPLLTEIEETFLTKLQKDIDNCETLWDARLKYLSLRNQFTATFRDVPLTWRGNEYDTNINIGKCEIFPVSKIDNRKFAIGSFKHCNTSFHPSFGIIVVQHDMIDEAYTKIRLRAKLEQLRFKTGASTIVLTKGVVNTDEIPADRTFLLSEIKLTTTKSGTSGERVSVIGSRVYVYNHWSYDMDIVRITETNTFSDILFEDENHEKTFVVPMVRSTVDMPRFSSFSKLPSIVRGRRGGNAMRIVGVSPTLARQFAGELANVRLFADWCKDRLDYLQSNNDLIEYMCQRAKYKSKCEADVFRHDWLHRYLFRLDREDDADIIAAWGWVGGSLLELHDVDAPIVPDGLILDDIEDFAFLMEYELLTDQSIIDRINEAKQILLTKVEELTTKYPLLVALRSIQTRMTSRSDIITIIKTVEGTTND